MKRFHVAPLAASELAIYHEVLECGDLHGRLVSQWDGSKIVVFDKEHAEALASEAIEWGNDIDVDLDAGRYDHDKRTYRQIAVGFWNLGARLRTWAASL